MEERRQQDEEEQRASEDYIQRLLAEEEELLQQERRRKHEDEQLAQLLSNQLVCLIPFSSSVTLSNKADEEHQPDCHWKLIGSRPCV